MLCRRVEFEDTDQGIKSKMWTPSDQRKHRHSSDEDDKVDPETKSQDYEDPDENKEKLYLGQTYYILTITGPDKLGGGEFEIRITF